MKAIRKSATTSLVWGIVATTGIVLTACSDELENTQYSNNVTVNTVQNTPSLQGTYQTVCTDPETGLNMNMTLDNGTVTVSAYDSDGEKGSATATLADTDNESLGTATLSSAVGDVKSFTLRKVGTFYLECKATMTNGTEKEIGFIPAAVVSRSTQDDVLSGAVNTVKIGLKLVLFQCPWLRPISGDLVTLIPGFDTATTDMSVTDCFTQLSIQISALDQKINNLAYEVKTYHDDDQIDAHRQEYNALQINNSTYINKLASISAALKTAPSDSVTIYQKEFNDCLVEWAKASTKNGCGYSAAIQYLLNTANGTSDHKTWSKVFDSCAERLFPWEHQGYETRQAFRDRDFVVNTESIVLLAMYKMTDDGKAVDLTNSRSAYTKIVENYLDKANQIVIDNDHAICQIKGANHVKINKKGFVTYANPYPCPYGYKVNSNFRDYVMPGLQYNNAEYVAKTALLNVEEGEAIMKYYNGKYTFREILSKECGITCTTDPKNNKDVVMPLWGSSVALTKVKDGHFVRHYKFIAEKALYLDKTSIGSFCMGVHKAWCGDNLLDLAIGRNYEFVKETIVPCQCIVTGLKIDGRTKGWVPGAN